MNKTSLQTLAIMVAALGLFASDVLGAYGGGSGTSADPYQIYDANQLNQIGLNQAHWSKYFILMADIDLSAYDGTDGRPQFNIIGRYDVTGSFRGNFNGNGHYISHFTFVDPNRSNIGIFVYTSGANIYDLGIVDSSVSGGLGSSVGALVAQASGGSITRCFTYNTTVSGARTGGGLVGSAGDTSFSDCYSLAAVSGGTYAGGIVCTLTGSGRGYAGVIRRCYAAGPVSATSGAGGLVGAIGGTTSVTDSFWDTQATGQSTSAAGLGKTTYEMRQGATFTAWVCDSAWRLDEGNDYPHLAWENTPGELLAPTSYGGGSGTASDPYLIYTAEQLNSIGLYSCHLSKCFKLMNDIDLYGYDGQGGRPAFNIIANSNTAFNGTFDGDGHTISNFTCITSQTTGVGIFGRADSSTLKNITLVNPQVSAPNASATGSLAGTAPHSTAENCHVLGGSVAGKSNVGGLCGQPGVMTRCSAAGASITATSQYAGGLGGYSAVGAVGECFTDCNVSAGSVAGGLLGYYSGSPVRSCYSLSRVISTSIAGGLIGTASSLGCHIEHSYAYGSVTSNTGSGGLVGSGQLSVSDAYWDISTTGQPASIGGGLGRTTEQMKDAATYIGWGAGSQWTIDDQNDYPRLAWQNAAGSPITRVAYSYGGGSGTTADPYLVFSAEQLRMLSLLEDDWDKSFRLMADIDLSHAGVGFFNPIGCHSKYFTGLFDGNYKVVSNLEITAPKSVATGLFGMTGLNAQIINLTLESPRITAGWYSAALIGDIAGDNLIVQNCHVRNGSVVTDGYSVGGLIGFGLYSNNALITKCSSSGSVSGSSMVGGLIGYISDCTISECSSRGTVTGGSGVGGLVGSLSNPCTAQRCYSRAAVTGTTDVAGLIGDVWDYWYAVNLVHCYATGRVTGTSPVGGLATGMGSTYNAVNCYWDTAATGQATSTGGTGKTTAQMQTQSTYSGWDFTNVWTICPGTNYPRFKWEVSPADIACPDGVWFKEYAIVTAHWLQSGCISPTYCAGADIDRSGTVGIMDLLAVFEGWLGEI